jgi:hypothetical protein
LRPGLAWILILLISASHVARLIGMNHQCPAENFLILGKSIVYLLLSSDPFLNRLFGIIFGLQKGCNDSTDDSVAICSLPNFSFLPNIILHYHRTFVKAKKLTLIYYY